MESGQRDTVELVSYLRKFRLEVRDGVIVHLLSSSTRASGCPQTSEEFAEWVIPKVWEREGRNVARVAARLSVSANNKMRRILSRGGRRRNK